MLPGAAALLVFVVPQVFAQQDTLTERQITAIRQSCLEAQVNMQRLQYSDTAARINRGSMYEAIMEKLIAPFNSRAALNRLQDSPALVAATTNIERTFADFKRHYTAYEDALSSTLQVKCQDQPVTFYDRLTATRELRRQLSKDIQQLSGLLAEYQRIIEEITKKTGGAAS
ncbi:MAG TPA: hypothetical protein VD907_00310 [Verrucomicrobiae bacterium]|nr:hypothetical protein [Verrucomicrobiae bacterium]